MLATKLVDKRDPHLKMCCSTIDVLNLKLLQVIGAQQNFHQKASRIQKGSKKCHKSLERGQISLSRIWPRSKRNEQRRERKPSKNDSLCVPTEGRAVLATEIVPSDFTCSVSSLGQSSLHYPPVDINLRRFQLAGMYAHSWPGRIQILHACM